MEDRDRTWHLVQIGDGFGSGAVSVEFLRRQRIVFYRPLMRRMKAVPKKRLSQAQRRRRVTILREKVEPFFPGYAFVTFTEAGEQWREIFKMAGIRGLVSAGGLPVRVPWQMIDEIRAREIDGAVPASTKLADLPYTIGMRVRVTDGPFASFSGIVTELPTDVKQVAGELTLEELDESYRVQLLVDIFGRSTPVSLSLSQLETI